MSDVIQYLIIGLIASGVLEYAIEGKNLQMTWEERILNIILYPVVIMTILLNKKKSTIVVSYLVAIWVLWNVMNSIN